MKIQTTRKLFAFITVIALFISIFVLFSACQKEASVDSKQTTTPLNSTIIYTDVKPDSVIKYGVRQQYNLDLNNDGITDFIIGFNYIQNRCGGEGVANRMSEYISPVGGYNQVLDTNGGPPAPAGTLNSSAVIGPDAQWSATPGQNLLTVENSQGTCPWGTNHFGAWYNVSDKYLGLKFIKNNNIYYGWVRLTSSGTSLTNFNEYSLTLKDYAYNSIPNQSILAGQTK
jgi:hypothetical protein